jgi:hypothetical protein
VKTGTVSIGDLTDRRTGCEIELTVVHEAPFRIGDRVTAFGDTNRMRRKVTHVRNKHSVVAILCMRPSRGYARHVRAKKATKRRLFK